VGFLQHAGLLGLVIGAGAASAVVLVEGGFRVALKANDPITAHLEYEIAQVRLQRSCHNWCAEVRQMLEVRAVKRPPSPHRDLYEGLRAIGRPETAESRAMREATEAHDRETVAAYLEQFRDRGLRLFDALVELEHLVDDSREGLRAPASIWQIEDGLTSVEFGAERVIGWIRPELLRGRLDPV
jgi:hypothetical protein